MTVLLTNLGPILALAGVLITAFFTWKRELDKGRKDLLIQAYTSLLEAAAKNAGPRANSVFMKFGSGQVLSPDELKYFEDANNQFVSAHSHVLIHGSKGVITALSNFYDAQSEGPAGVEKTKQAYVALLSAMRHDSAAKDYESFGTHVDNIIGSGPDRRREKLFRQIAEAQARGELPGAPGSPTTPSGLTMSFSQPINMRLDSDPADRD
jgi:hypothetical protein